jgi:hypothetical protein
MTTERIQVDIRAVDNTRAATTSFKKNVDSITNSINQANKATAQMGAAQRTMTRQMRAQATQMGYQIQDVAVQLQMGQNALMVLGQQGSQVASLFGVGGALFGAFLAVGSAVATALLPNLKNTKTALEQLSEANKAALDTTERLKNGQIVLSSALIKTYEVNKKLAQLELHKYMLDFEKATKKAKEALMDIVQPTVGGGFGFRDELSDASEATQRLLLDLNRLARFSREGLGTGALYFGNLKEQEAALTRLTTAFEMMGVPAAEINKTIGLFNRAISEGGTSGDIQAYVDQLTDLANKSSDPVFVDFVHVLATQASKLTQTSQSVQYLSDAIKGNLNQAVESSSKALDTQGKTVKYVEQEMDFAVSAFYRYTEQAKALQAELDLLIAAEDKKTETGKRLLSSLDQQLEKLREGAVASMRMRVMTMDLTEADRAAALAKLDLIDKTQQQIDKQKEAEKQLKKEMKDRANMIKDLSSKTSDYFVDMISGTKSVAESFKGMARSIISDLTKMYIQKTITTPLFTSLMGFSNTPAPVVDRSIFSVPQKAIGGAVTGNTPYLVGEKGPELFIPSGAGSITKNSDLGGENVTVVQNINVSTGVQQTVRTEIMGLMPQIASAAKGAVLDARRRGGSFAGAF